MIRAGTPLPTVPDPSHSDSGWKTKRRKVRLKLKKTKRRKVRLKLKGMNYFLIILKGNSVKITPSSSICCLCEEMFHKSVWCPNNVGGGGALGGQNNLEGHNLGGGAEPLGVMNYVFKCLTPFAVFLEDYP